MIIYNVTTNINSARHEEWLDWMQHVHIPAVLACGKFSKARLVKVLVEDNDESSTYSVQFFTDSKATLERYYEEDAPRLRQESLERFGDSALSFRTELQLICDHEAI
jgi:hypothetical protein